MKPFSIIAAVIFLLMALAHLYRLAVGFPITIGAMDVAPGVSWAGLVVASVLSIGLFREGLRGNPHLIRLTADFNPNNSSEIIVTPKIELPRGSNGHRFRFELDDRTGKNVKFASLTSADDCSTCPPETAKPHTQIVLKSIDNNPPHGKPRTAEFLNRNDNVQPRPMDVSYQWEFTCDSGATVLPYDPIISNGGRV